MTVGSQVKGCYASIKGIEATLDMLSYKTQSQEARDAFLEAQKEVEHIKADLQKQLIFLTQEEPQYK